MAARTSAYVLYTAPGAVLRSFLSSVYAQQTE